MSKEYTTHVCKSQYTMDHTVFTVFLMDQPRELAAVDLLLPHKQLSRGWIMYS